MLNKLILTVVLTISTGCNYFDNNSCSKNIDNRTAVLLQKFKDLKKFNTFNLKQYCVFNNNDNFIENVKIYEKKINNEDVFYIYLIYSYLYQDDYRLSIFLDYLFENKVDIEDLYFSVFNNKNLMKDLNYNEKDLLKLEIIGKTIKNMSKGYE